MAALWVGGRVWLVCAAAAVVSGYAAGILHGPVVAWLGAMAVTSWRLRSSEGPARAAWVAATIVLGLLLGLHVLPGFTNPTVIQDAVLASGARPYSQHVNFDKTLGGVLLLGCSGWLPLRSAADWRSALRRGVPVAALTVVVVMAASLGIGYVQFDPRWPHALIVWGPVNLLTTCLSEEAFFRGLIQRELHAALHHRHAGTIAVAVSAASFGVAHAAGGWEYVVLAALAGVGYAVAYQRTGRLEMAVLTHFTVNLVHFVLFTYPALR